jgi:hypothetical protein
LLVFFVIRVLVAPGPVMPLLLAMLLVVITIFSALLGQVIPVGAVLAIVPIVVIVVVTIVDPDLDSGVLRCGAGQDSDWRHKCGCQDQ